MAQNIVCPMCNQGYVVKVGKSAVGKQRYRCQNANCKTLTFQHRYTYSGCQRVIAPPRIMGARPLVL